MLVCGWNVEIEHLVARRDDHFGGLRPIISDGDSKSQSESKMSSLHWFSPEPNRGTTLALSNLHAIILSQCKQLSAANASEVGIVPFSGLRTQLGLVKSPASLARRA